VALVAAEATQVAVVAGPRALEAVAAHLDEEVGLGDKVQVPVPEL
jgi:hypothetical protein